MCHKYVSVAVLNHNTSYDTSIDCETSSAFHGRIPFNILDLILGVRPQPALIPILQNAQDVLHQAEMIYEDVHRNAMQTYIKYKAYYDKKPTLQNSKSQVKYMSYSWKQIIKAVKFNLLNFGGPALTLLKRCYLTTITRYAKLAPTKRKRFTACKSVSSHTVNSKLTHESRHKNGNPIRKWDSNTMICMPECGSVNKESQFLTTRIIMQRHPIPPKFQNHLIY